MENTEEFDIIVRGRYLDILFVSCEVLTGLQILSLLKELYRPLMDKSFEWFQMKLPNHLNY